MNKIYLVSLNKKDFVFQSIKKIRCDFYMIDYKREHPKKPIYLFEQEEGKEPVLIKEM